MALYQSLMFFNQKNDSSLVFLAQIDFWDFEMDSLIYCFESFEERSKAWESPGAVEKMLSKQNFVPKKKILNDFVNDKPYQKRIVWKNKKKGNDVESPYRALERCVKEWNKLVDRCQNMLVSEKFEKTAKLCGMKVNRDLSKYEKTINNKT